MVLMPGDDLEPVMLSSGFAATQNAVEANKVMEYARSMAAGTWVWLPVNRRNPIILDSAGGIMSGHHRLVAARLANATIPVGAIMHFPGITARPHRSWASVQVI